MLITSISSYIIKEFYIYEMAQKDRWLYLYWNYS